MPPDVLTRWRHRTLDAALLLATGGVLAIVNAVVPWVLLQLIVTVVGIMALVVWLQRRGV